MPHLALVAIVVRDYDEAIEFYVNKLGFELVEDRQQTPDKRWVVVRPRATDDRLPNQTGLLLAKAVGQKQQAAIGNQTGGRVGLFLQTGDFARDYQRMQANGVKFVEQPRSETYGQVMIFEGLCGNRWDLIEPK
jgi:catechol 2,3-dioxygenase-like lactoylglutathione lyase family enzyme